jgi:CDP-diacylglycerol--glycerol-3-phosphate 3-phosphatidyltransferase
VSLADALTLFRALAGIPIFIAIGYGDRSLALAIFVAAALSDAVDGWLARRAGTTGGRGVVLDPLADKALVTLTLVALALAGLVPLALAALVVVRELFVALLRAQAHRRGARIPATLSTKLKTACEMAALTLLIWGPSASSADAGVVLLSAALAIGLATLPLYLPHPRRRLT